jgi:hypothetical protein
MKTTLQTKINAIHSENMIKIHNINTHALKTRDNAKIVENRAHTKCITNLGSCVASQNISHILMKNVMCVRFY